MGVLLILHLTANLYLYHPAKKMSASICKPPTKYMFNVKNTNTAKDGKSFKANNKASRMTKMTPFLCLSC